MGLSCDDASVIAQSVVFHTSFGYVALLYVDRVTRVSLPHPTLEAALAEHPALWEAHLASEHPRFVSVLVERIRLYLSGVETTFSLTCLDLSQCHGFQLKVLSENHAIPYGQVRSYGDIAEQLGRPGAARAVGTALSRNRFPLVIPCHRCIRSDGSVGGFRLPGLKGRLLELEGHRIEDGRVSAYGRGRPGINAGTCPD